MGDCVSGGDLDGDTYHVTDYVLLHPTRSKLSQPGEYGLPKRKTLTRPCTMEDVAEFVVEFLNSDVSCIKHTLLFSHHAPSEYWYRRIILASAL